VGVCPVGPKLKPATDKVKGGLLLLFLVGSWDVLDFPLAPPPLEIFSANTLVPIFLCLSLIYLQATSKNLKLIGLPEVSQF